MKNAIKEWFRKPKYIAVLGGGEMILKDFTVTHVEKGRLKSQKFSTKNMSAYLEEGVAQNSHSSKGAIGVGTVAGAVLLGPVGAVAGGLLGSAKRKGGTKLYLVIRDSEDTPIITKEFLAKDEGELRTFVQAFNDSANDPENS